MTKQTDPAIANPRQACAPIKISRAMISRGVDSLRKSGALAEPEIGVAALVEQLLRVCLHPQTFGTKGSSASQKPSKTASRIDLGL